MFLQLASSAEQMFAADPNTTLIKLRQFGEAIARELAARVGLSIEPGSSQAELLFRLGREIRLDTTVIGLFHSLRVAGNQAVHEFHTRHSQAIDGLRVARALAIWFHRSFGQDGNHFQPGPFVTPADPSAQLRALQADLERLRTNLASREQALDSSQQP